MSISENFKRAVFAKENGICRKCHQHCDENGCEVMCLVPFSASMMHDLSKFYIVHMGCKDKAHDEKSIFLREVIRPYFVLYAAGIALMTYGVLDFVKNYEVNMNYFFAGFAVAAMGRFVWKIHQHSYIKDDKEIKTADHWHFNRIRHFRMSKYQSGTNAGRVMKAVIMIAAYLFAAIALGAILYFHSGNIASILQP